MYDELHKFCEELRNGGLEGLCDDVCEDVFSLFNEKYTKDVLEPCCNHRRTGILWSWLRKCQESNSHK